MLFEIYVITKSTEETVMEGSGIMASCTSNNPLAREMRFLILIRYNVRHLLLVR